MLPVVKFKRPGQQNHVYDAETLLSGNPDVWYQSKEYNILMTLNSTTHSFVAHKIVFIACIIVMKLWRVLKGTIT